MRWDLRTDPATNAPSQPQAGGVAAGGGAGGAGGAAAQPGRGRGGAPTGTLVAPGKYRVTVKIPGLSKELSAEVLVESDPYSHR